MCLSEPSRKVKARGCPGDEHEKFRLLGINECGEHGKPNKDCLSLSQNHRILALC